ncbi:amidase [Salicibibacter cibarius]|uniref:Amidase n=1 Tax=Salicibibacter cibarius TaxID=2743000 RepID=A0A7T6Z3U0_9BACI|nr:amidase [Salicibibacter cibarius]QQK76515.1 amidase [Salicibibacter cibarius]
MDLAFMSVAELALKIRRRELSPVEIVESTIKRIEKRNDRTNAFVHLAFEEAREKAKNTEKALMSGEAIGPLHGIPTAMKDLFDFYPGWPTTLGGIRVLKDNLDDKHCVYAERIEQAGSIIMGKTNSPTMGLRGVTDNYLFGPTRNPFDLSKNSGGSSGGSAAAVADGLVPIAEGTDGGGSIRIPASWCGLYGYKASVGRVPFVSRPNAFGSGNIFLFEGTLTRNVEDAAIGLNALSGYHSRDPFSIDTNSNFTSILGRSVKGLKIAYSPNFDIFPVDKEVENVVSHSVKTFEELGAHVEEINVGINHSQQELSDLWCRLMIISNIEAFEEYKKGGIDLLGDHRDDLPPEYVSWLEKGYNMDIHDIIKDQRIRTELYDAIENIFEKYDLLITPTLASLPVENADNGNTVGPTQINGEEVDPLIGWCLTYITNFTGHPSASVPAGLSNSNLPIGMQIIGKRYADDDVLSASAAFERIKPWHNIYNLTQKEPV